MTRRLYIVDDDDAVRASLEALLGRIADLSVLGFESGDAFLEAMDSLPPGAVLLDIHMRGASGLDVLIRLAGRPGLPAIVITGQGDDDLKLATMRAGAAAFLQKPFDHLELFATIERVIKSLGA